MIRIGIYGYGNLGKGVEKAIKQNKDMKLAAVFTRRKPETIELETPGVKARSIYDILSFKDKIDVMIVCGGSATDLPNMTPALVRDFNVLDSFDTHANIPRHFAKVDAAAREYNNAALISCGWDPGMFSLARLYSQCILPEGKDYTFWGKGVSQGHSDAIRRIHGVVDARQYTIPREEALERIRNGETPDLTAGEKHLRECYVVVDENADKDIVRDTIVNMPNYFEDYETIVHFVSQEELDRDHAELPHGGFVIRTGSTGTNNEHKHTIEYSLKLDSNPEFTANVLVAYARALARMSARGDFGCKTVFDIPPALLSPLPPEKLRAKLL